MKREPWHDSLLESLEILANLPLQARIWVDGDDTIFLESPTELVCQVFDDGVMDDLLEGASVFSDDTDKILREMDSLVERIDLEQSPRRLLNDPDWMDLSQLAQTAHNNLQRLLSAS